MNKHFVLLVNFPQGECAFPTDTEDLIGALKEFDMERRTGFSTSILNDKNFALPRIVSARIVKIFSKDW